MSKNITLVVLLVFKYLLISFSAIYIIIVVWNIPEVLSSFQNNYQNNQIDKKQVKNVYIILMVISILTVFLGIIAALFHNYNYSMVLSVLKILTFLLIFAQLICQPIIINLMNILITLLSLIFSYFLWLKSQQINETIALLTEELMWKTWK